LPTPPRIYTVHVPADVATASLAAEAITRFRTASKRTTDVTLTGHFLAAGRTGRRHLLPLTAGRHTAGGPLRLLDLSRMRAVNGAAYAARWGLWQHVVAGTRPAKPFWAFEDRHRDNPSHYPAWMAARDYGSQPRIAAMRANNTSRRRRMLLPTTHLEAFQTNLATYTLLGEATAITAHGLVINGQFLTTASERLADLQTHLEQASRALASLSGDCQLAAVTCP
jgi:hypothetical protein